MKIGIFYTTSNESTKKSCEILSAKLNADTKLIPIENAKDNCILKYNFLILAASAINGKVQSTLKIYISRNIKNLKEKPKALIINCEEDIDRFEKTFTRDLLDSSHINSNFGFELKTDDTNFIEKRKTNKLIKKYENNNKELPSINLKEIDKFADYMNNLIEKRVD